MLRAARCALLASSALIAITPNVARADGGTGGNLGVSAAGGAGGTDSATGSGGTGGMGAAIAPPFTGGGGGGGGGGGVTGGTGGVGGGPAGGAGGAGGATAGANGANGGPGFSDSGGGGGGGGAHGGVSATLPAIGSFVGGNGGQGGDGTTTGGGGAGGYGLVITGSGNIGNSQALQITGGTGGSDGNGATAGSAPGTGGHGLVIANTSGVTLTIGSGPVRGGDGGSSFTDGFARGGIGIVGQNLNLTLDGSTVSGGFDPNTGLRSPSLGFTGGSNTLTITANGATLTGDITVAGALNFAQAVDTTIGNAITGSGSITKSGAGVLTLTSANFYGGGTTVSAGTLFLGGASTLGDVSGATTVSGGTLDLGGRAQAQNGGVTQTGGTIQNGTLQSSGTIALQGGTYNASIIVASGGTLAPGNGIGTANVGGTVTFNSGTTYAVDVSPSAADKTVTTGAAVLTGGTVRATYQAGSYLTNTYTIFTANGTRGGTQFAGLTNVNLPAGFSAALAYPNANDATLVLTMNAAPAAGGGAPSGLPGNAQAAANSIGNYFNNGGALPPGFVTLAGSSNPSNAYGQVAGQPGAAQTQSGQAQTTQFINSIFDTLIDTDGNGGAANFADDALGYASGKNRSAAAQEAYAAVTPRAPVFTSRWNAWAVGYGGNQRVDGNAAAGTNTTTSRAYGVAAGADYRFTPDTRIGIAMGGAGTSFSLDQAFGGGSADMFNAALYAKHNLGAAYMAGALVYAWQDAKTDRTVTVAGIDRLHASFNASALAGRIEGGYRYVLPALTLIPYAAIQSTTFFLPAYGEVATSGSNQFALNYTAHDVTATRGELGARFDKVMLVQGGTFAWKGKLAWAHDWNNDRRATATFQALVGSSSFTVNGAQPSANAALVSLGGEMAWHNGWSVAANFDGEFSSTTRAYAGKATLRRIW